MWSETKNMKLKYETEKMFIFNKIKLGIIICSLSRKFLISDYISLNSLCENVPTELQIAATRYTVFVFFFI